MRFKFSLDAQSSALSYTHLVHTHAVVYMLGMHEQQMHALFPPAPLSTSQTPAEASKADVVHFLSNDSDAEVSSAIKSYMRAAYANKSKSVEKPEEKYELASKVQRKYIAAQIVESGIQVRPGQGRGMEERFVGRVHGRGQALCALPGGPLGCPAAGACL